MIDKDKEFFLPDFVSPLSREFPSSGGGNAESGQ
jgi:hypothetical protein